MHILHVYKDYYPVLGGIENHIRWLAEGQAAAGHRVTVLACAPGWRTARETIQGVEVIKAGRLATLASMPLSLSQPYHLRRLHPDVVHLHAPYPLGELSNWLLGRARATVLTYHSDVIRQRRLLRLYGPFLRRILRAADAIIVTSAAYVEHSPWLRPVRDRCVVVPLGIDLTGFIEQATPGEAPPYTVLFVGRLRYYKGLDTLLEALPAVPEARLVVVGTGPMLEPWKALAARLDLDERVVFIGHVADADLPACYTAADLFVLPANTRAEAFGTVLLEAMAAGLPVISTELGTGTSWVNQDGVTGRVVPPLDPAALAAALTDLLGDVEQRRHMGLAARARVEQEFTLPVMIQRVEAVYRQVLTRKEAPVP